MENNLLLSHTLFEGAGETWTDVLSYQSLRKEDKYKFPSKIILDYVQFVDRIQLEYADQKLPMMSIYSRLLASIASLEGQTI